MSFSYDLATTAGQVRLRLGDTDSAAYVFEDAEIDYFASEGGTVNGALALALRTLLVSRAHRVKRATVHGLSIDDTAQIAAIREALAQLGSGSAPTVQIVGPTLQPYDRDYTP